MRTSIDALAGAQSSSEALAATGLIGREALVSSSSFGVSDDSSRPLPKIVLEASSPTPVLGVEVRNARGAVVARNSSIGTVSHGRTELDW